MKKFILFLTMILLLVGCKGKNSNEAENTQNVVEEEPVAETVALEDVSFLNDFKTEPVEVAFTPREVSPKVIEYSVNDDLSNIENIKDFGDFTDEQKKSLVENSFVITNLTGSTMDYMDTTEQLFYIYEENEYKEIPYLLRQLPK